MNRRQKINGRRIQKDAEKVATESREQSLVINMIGSQSERAVRNAHCRSVVAQALALPGIHAADRAVIEDFSRYLAEDPLRRLTQNQERAVVGVIREDHAARAEQRPVKRVFGERLGPDAFGAKARAALAPFLRGELTGLPKAPPSRRA